MIERRRHWNGTPPQQTEKMPIVLPPLKDVLVGEECYIPAGWFWFGHEDSLQRIWMEAYIIQKYPVTNRQYLEFLNTLVQEGRTEEAFDVCSKGSVQVDLANAERCCMNKKTMVCFH